MKYARVLLAAMATAPFAISAQGARPAPAAKNHTVFDLVLNSTFDIRECAFEVVETQVGKEGIAVGKRNRGLFGKPDHVSRVYRYTEQMPASGKCFQRVGPFYTSSPVPGMPLPPVVPPNDQKVKLLYADDVRPSIADAEDIWVGIQDTKLTGVRFYFRTGNEREVLQTLQKKYGKPASSDKYYVQGPAGDIKNYYDAKWNLPELQVTFLSLDTNQIGYDPENAPLGYYSVVGSVTVQYKVQQARKDNNPL